MARKPSINRLYWNKLPNMITEFGNLARNWDTYGGLPISVGVIVNALYFIGTIDQKKILPPSAVPTSIGHIQLEWHTKTGDLELQLDSKGGIEGYYSEKDIDYDWNEMIINCPLTHQMLDRFSI